MLEWFDCEYFLGIDNKNFKRSVCIHIHTLFDAVVYRKFNTPAIRARARICDLKFVNIIVAK